MKNLSIEGIAMFLLILGGLNAGVNAVFSYDALGQIMSSGVSTGFYALVGLAAVYAVAGRFGWISQD